MKRIIMHWTAGGHTVSATDRRHYHEIIDGSGKVHNGNHPPQANAHIANPNDGSTYAAHTLGANTGSIGIAVAAMRGAKERPFDAGPSPITGAQVQALVDRVAALCRQYGIPVTPETVLTHAEVQQTFGIAQRGKWDITWLPGMTAPSSAVAVGADLRARVKASLQAASARDKAIPPAPAQGQPTGGKTGLWAMLAGIIAKLWGRG